MTLDHPLVLLFGAAVFAVTLIGIGGAIVTAWQARKGQRSSINRDDSFWKENGDTWLGP